MLSTSNITPGRQQIPSFQLASGTTNERDNSYNISNTLGSIFYNTDTSNVEIRHEDPSNNVGWRDLVMNNKEQIDISGKLVVDGDVSLNAHLSAVDASFQNNVDISGKLVVDADAYVKGNITAGGTVFIPNGNVTTTLHNLIPNIAPTATYTHFDQSLRIYRDSGDYREYQIGILGDNTNTGNILAFGGYGGGDPDPNIVMGMTSGGNVEIAGEIKSATIGGTTTYNGSELLVFRGAGNYPRLEIYGDNDGSSVSVELGRHNSPGDGYLRLRNNNVPTNGIFLRGDGSSYIMGGNLGIGKTNPLVPLHVYSSNNFETNHTGISSLSGMTGINYIAHHIQSNKVDRHNFSTDAAGHNISIYAEGAVFSGSYIGASDKRIKKNITEIDDERSLVQLRNLPCVDYDYVDNFKNGEYKTVGFIAQDVKEIMPNCVETVSDIIPNEMRVLENLEWEPVVKDISSNESGYKLINQELEEASYKFFVRDFSSNEKPLEVSYPFIFEKKWDEVFCYGKRVDDFLAIDKNKIFALGFSATQQIDRIQQKHIIDISNMKTENTELKRQIIQLTTDISFMKTENTEQKGQIIELKTDISLIRNHIGI